MEEKKQINPACDPMIDVEHLIFLRKIKIWNQTCKIPISYLNNNDKLFQLFFVLSKGFYMKPFSVDIIPFSLKIHEDKKPNVDKMKRCNVL